eukprot:5130245-Pyramimonas_sp.AAC.1
MKFTHPLFQQFFVAEHFLGVLESDDGAGFDHLATLPPISELMVMPWWARVLDLCDEASDLFYDKVVDHFYQSSRVEIEAWQLQGHTGRDVACRLVGRTSAVSAVIIAGDPHPSEYITVDREG